MNWVKTNLQLVLFGGVILVLLGAAGWFLYTQMEAEKAAQARLDQGIRDLNRLKNHDPHPIGDPSQGIENIENIRQEQKRIQKELLEPMREAFKPFAFPSPLDPPRFKSLLEERIAAMQKAAHAAGTKLPRDNINSEEYSFSFSDIRPKLKFDLETLQPLAFQLVQVESLCQVLFNSRIHALKKIRRPEVKAEEDAEEEEDGYGSDFEDEEEEDGYGSDFEDEEEEQLASSANPYAQYYPQMMMGHNNPFGVKTSMGSLSSDYIKETPTTNEVTGAVLYPFLLRFQCFSKELSDVMTGLNNSDHFFLVKWIAVDRADYNSQLNFNTSHLDYRDNYGGNSYSENPYNTSRYRMGLPEMPGIRYSGSSSYNASTDKDLREKPLTVNILVEVISFPPQVEQPESINPLSAGTYSGATRF